METVPVDYGKRVYQGVRVKHTVKDLLAEKRSRQTSNSWLNGSSTATTQSSFIPLAGSPPVSGYYGVRRSLVADMDLQSNKHLSSDACTSSLVAKPFAYESPAAQGYPSLLDAHFIDQYADPRTATVTSGASSLFGASSLASFPSDSAHFLTRDSWEQALPDSLGQADACPPDSLQVSSASTVCLSSPEPGISSQYRNPSWNSPISGTQSYSFHALDDVHYATGYSAASPYPFSSFMTTMAGDLTPKMLQAASEESPDTAPLHNNGSLWPKEDGSPLWGTYECRRTY
ncbi:POU domain class 2-associating factor 2 [Rhineura floridana]|uniref:POU domain class 2-associating factor 2 n=1 Tax=Rhineura floridana TaxID=261503 RepID=UPI002AC7F6EB|nr:POU domain class 2-associating factor 2 [Rhineura floridana]